MSRFLLVALAVFACWHLASPSQAGTLAQFRTVYGDLEVTLFDQEKPVTTGNFKRLVEAGAYQNTFFHRLIPGFVAQGGGFFTLSKANTNLFAPPWSLLGSVPSFGAITNEFAVGPFLSNTNGTIAMAKLGGSPDSATCEWFFNLGNNSANLDNQNGGFTVFGRVVRDTGPTNTGGLLGLFNQLGYFNGVQPMQAWYPNDALATNVFTDLAVVYAGAVPPRYNNLFYVDVTLLSVAITLTNDSRAISWNSVAGRTNIVEYTSTMPPAWNTLTTTNGNGTRLTVIDPVSANLFRFYRIRVGY